MVSIYQVNPNELIEKLAKELEGFNEIKAPEWAKFVKTGHSRERPPEDPNWWYFRFAAVLRSIYKLGPIGVSKLRTKYGGRKNRGVKPEHFYKGSGNILRKILQQGEEAGLLKQTEKGVHKGRILTPKGNSLLDRVALGILKGKPISTAKPRQEKLKGKLAVEKPAKKVKGAPEKPQEDKKSLQGSTSQDKKEEKPKPQEAEEKPENPAKKSEPKPKEKPAKRTPEKSEKIAEVEKEVKEIEKKKKEKTKKIKKEVMKKKKEKEEIKAVEEIVKKLTLKKIKEQKKK
ncbi:30S ribosomal protein S19e [Candidatus Woesearchaeota archaeon]|nr:30S ribosomal protein S19e [Candidatus Woesearchaeota archaeon]